MANVSRYVDAERRMKTFSAPESTKKSVRAECSVAFQPD